MPVVEPNARLLAEKRLCEGLNAKGKPCRSDAAPGRPYCIRHDPDLSEDERRRRLSRWGRMLADLPKHEGGES
jgi:hypothetical protein